MNHEYLPPSLYIRQVNLDQSIESARACECRIEYILLICGCKYNYIRISVEPIHLNQQLVQGVVAFIVTSSETGCSFLTNCVDLIDEYY